MSLSDILNNHFEIRDIERKNSMKSIYEYLDYRKYKRNHITFMSFIRNEYCKIHRATATILKNMNTFLYL